MKKILSMLVILLITASSTKAQDKVSNWTFNTRLKKGDNIEGRNNRALQKTISGFIKLLFPTGQPTD